MKSLLIAYLLSAWRRGSDRLRWRLNSLPRHPELLERPPAADDLRKDVETELRESKRENGPAIRRSRSATYLLLSLSLALHSVLELALRSDIVDPAILPPR